MYSDNGYYTAHQTEGARIQRKMRICPILFGCERRMQFQMPLWVPWHLRPCHPGSTLVSQHTGYVTLVCGVIKLCQERYKWEANVSLHWSTMSPNSRVQWRLSCTLITLALDKGAGHFHVSAALAVGRRPDVQWRGGFLGLGPGRDAVAKKSPCPGSNPGRLIAFTSRFEHWEK